MISDNELTSAATARSGPARPVEGREPRGSRLPSAAPERVIHRWVAACCAALALGSIGTWAHVSVAGVHITASGIAGWWGRLTLAAAVITVVVVALPDWVRSWDWGSAHALDIALVAAWAAFGASLYCLLSPNGDGYSWSGVTKPSWGVYLCTIAAAGLVAAVLMLRRQAPATASPMEPIS